MQQSEAFHQELRSVYRARVRDSFIRARSCVQSARQARWEGDIGRLRKLLKCARILRAAAAGWRERALSVVPMLLACLLLSLVGCTRQSDETMTLSLTADRDGTVTWSLKMPRQAWRDLQPATVDARTFQLSRQTSSSLIGAIDEALAARGLCPGHWQFGPGFQLRDGSLIFTGRCDQRLVKG